LFNSGSGSNSDQIPGLLSPIHDPRLFAANAVMVANELRGMRAVAPKTGTIVDLAVFVGTSSGNIDVGLYNCQVEPRVKLFSTGSIACPSAGWQIVGQPNVPIQAGQSIDLVLCCDNITATFARSQGANNNIVLMPNNNFWNVGGGSLRTCYSLAAAFPLPVNLSDAGLAGSSDIRGVIARII